MAMSQLPSLSSSLQSQNKERVISKTLSGFAEIVTILIHEYGDRGVVASH